MSEGRSVQQDLPAEPHPESREETIAHAIEESGAPADALDPSTRRRFGFVLGRALATWATVGAVVGAVAGVVLSLAPGPFETGSVGGAIGYAVVLAVAGALIFSIIGGLFTVEREDGRVEKDVERTTGPGPDGPAPT